MENNCNCNVIERIVIACSGAADTGQITDLVARRLRNNKKRSMSCLSAVGAGSQEFIDKMKAANVLAIDGCQADCAKKILEQANVHGYRHLRITDLGYEKGKTPVNEKVLEEIYLKAETIK